MQRELLHFKRALLIIPIAIIGMFFLNAVRLVILVAIGHFYSSDLALNGFHSVGGWFNLLFVLIASLWTLNNFQWFLKGCAPTSPRVKGWGEIEFLYPLMFLIAASLLMKVFTVDFQWLYPIPIFAATYLIFYYRDKFNKILVLFSGTSVGMGVLIFFLWIYLIPIDSTENSIFFNHLQSAPLGISLIWLLLRIVGASIVVPIVEELAFRGYMLPRMELWATPYILQCKGIKISLPQAKTLSLAASLVFTSFLFGVLHSNILAGSIAGFGFGLAYLYRRKLIDAIVAHSVTNTLLGVYVIYSGNWAYW